MFSNSVTSRYSTPNGIAKFTVVKKIREFKLKRMSPPLATDIYISCFSMYSYAYYELLKRASKETYVGSSSNPFIGDALFAAQNIKAGEFIKLYEGWRMAYRECDARQKRGRPWEYALYISKGVVVDALGFLDSAGMANHSCRPNARLRHGYLPGPDRAPYGYLQALRDISMGDEIECDYGYINHLTSTQLESIINSGRYIQCRCLKPECCKVFLPTDPQYS